VSRVAREFPAQEGYGEYEDRGSRFLAWVFHAPEEASFSSRLEEVRLEHPKARHFCWAWRIAAGYRFNDDGEPGGTAGRPMLQVLEGSGLEDLAAICVRYFGGVKLGTGGLARAYSGATARALEHAGRQTEVLRSRFALHFPFASLGIRTELEAVFPSCVFDGEFCDDGWRGEMEIGEEEVMRVRAFLAERGMRLE
jgi:uncharacterized YigZ family protein